MSTFVGIDYNINGVFSEKNNNIIIKMIKKILFEFFFLSFLPVKLKEHKVVLIYLEVYCLSSWWEIFKSSMDRSPCGRVRKIEIFIYIRRERERKERETFETKKREKINRLR